MVRTQSHFEHRIYSSSAAGLEQNVPIPWHDSEFASHNRTILDTAWKMLDDNVGVVSLDDDFTTENGLPKAQRWPWSKSKGVYLLQAYHNIHCLVSNLPCFTHILTRI